MPYAHKLDVYLDPPHKKVVFCIYCGQDADLTGKCPGEVKIPAKNDADFMRIFARSPVRASKQLEKILKRA